MDGQFQYPAIAGDLDSRWRSKGASRGRRSRATLDWYSGTCLYALGRRNGRPSGWSPNSYPIPPIERHSTPGARLRGLCGPPRVLATHYHSAGNQPPEQHFESCAQHDLEPDRGSETSNSDQCVHRHRVHRHNGGNAVGRGNRPTRTHQYSHRSKRVLCLGRHLFTRTTRCSP